MITGFIFKTNYKIISLLSFIFSFVITIFANLFSNSIIFLLASYFIISLLLSLISLFLQDRILKYETDLKFVFLIYSNREAYLKCLVFLWYYF